MYYDSEQAEKDLREAGYVFVATKSPGYWGGAAWGVHPDGKARVITWETEGTCDYCYYGVSDEHDFSSSAEARDFFDRT